MSFDKNKLLELVEGKIIDPAPYAEDERYETMRNTLTALIEEVARLREIADHGHEIKLCKLCNGKGYVPTKYSTSGQAICVRCGGTGDE